MEKNSVVLSVATIKMMLMILLTILMKTEISTASNCRHSDAIATRNQINVVVVAPNETEWISYTLAYPAVQMAIENSGVKLPGIEVVTPFLVTNNQRYVEISTDGDTKNGHTLYDYALIPKLRGRHSTCQLDVIIGMARGDYAYRVMEEESTWKIPVISLASQNWRLRLHDFVEEYPMLTLAGPTDDQTMIGMLIAYMKRNNWSRIKMIIDRNFNDSVSPKDCYSQTLSTWEPTLENHGLDVDHISYSTIIESVPFDELLEGDYRVFLVCMKPADLREMMIWAHGNNFTNGDHVFISVRDNPSPLPWFDENDTQERNEAAAKAFQAVQIITPKKPTSHEYKMFSSEVKRRALKQFPDADIDIGTGEVNNYVGSYYDATLLYLLALSETVQAGQSSKDRTAIAQRIRGMTFDGIMGTYRIDENGTRRMDYSLLTMNPLHDKYEVSANYDSIKEQFEIIPSRQIYWIGGNPPDDGGDTSPGNEARRCSDVMNVLLVLAIMVTQFTGLIVSGHHILQTRL